LAKCARDSEIARLDVAEGWADGFSPPIQHGKLLEGLERRRMWDSAQRVVLVAIALSVLARLLSLGAQAAANPAVVSVSGMFSHARWIAAPAATGQ
jgi:hypothetical protein